MTCCRSGVNAVDRRHIPLRPIDKKHWSADLLFYIIGDHARRIAADLEVSRPQHSPMHCVVCDKRNQSAVEILQSNEPDLPVNRTVRVQAQQDFSIYVSSPAIYVRRREAETYTEA